MAPMPSVEEQRLGGRDRDTLLSLARRSIEHGLEQGGPLRVNSAEHEPALQAQGAAFVTLKKQGRLRGCIGHLEAVQALVLDVAENAFAAAFRDPRFAPLGPGELDSLRIEISVLSPSEPLDVSSESDLLSRIEPRRDGLILQAGSARGTFLPSVWESLPEPHEFLRHLKIKAGLPADFWSSSVRVWRYRTESFAEAVHSDR